MYVEYERYEMTKILSILYYTELCRRKKRASYLLSMPPTSYRTRRTNDPKDWQKFKLLTCKMAYNNYGEKCVIPGENSNPKSYTLNKLLANFLLSSQNQMISLLYLFAIYVLNQCQTLWST